MSLATINATLLELQQQINSLQLKHSKGCGSIPILITKQEIKKMPQNIRKALRIEGFTVYARLRTKDNSRYLHTYEIRFRRCGYNITASGKTIEEAKDKFKNKLKSADKNDGKPVKVQTFGTFAEYWFTNFHARKVKSNTYKNTYGVYKRTIYPVLGEVKLTTVTPVMLQSLLDGLSENGKGRTADEVYTLLNQILTSAVKHGILQLNPLGMVFHKTHVVINGVALTKDEEKTLLTTAKGSKYELYIAVSLYTGIRPNEYGYGIEVRDNMLYIRNSKRHSGKDEYKRIPICKMLAPYLVGLTEIPPVSTQNLTLSYKKILPTHKLYDLRTTFQTRLTECNIPDTVIGLVMGNGIGKLKSTYTDVSDEYLIREFEKFVY